MKEDEVKLITFETLPIPVAKARYKDSVYFIADGKDITDYVSRVHGDLDVDIHSLQNVINVYLEENPDSNVISYPKYKFVLVDDETTSVGFVEMYCTDVLGYNPRQCSEVVRILNSSKHEYVVGTYVYELAITLKNILINGNMNFNQRLGSYIEEVKVQKDETQYFEVLQTLIKRDYPSDI